MNGKQINRLLEILLPDKFVMIVEQVELKKLVNNVVVTLTHSMLILNFANMEM